VPIFFLGTIIMNNYLNLLKILSKNTHSGYTLIELIIASILTVMVISAAGMGVVFMTQKNMIVSTDSDIKYNLGRAVDFISEEVKTASAIRDTNLTANTPGSADPLDNFNPSGKTIVLVIKVPGVTSDIVYYTKAPGDPWLGKLAIYRWGPPMDANGAYTNGNWTDQLLVDLIATTPKTTSCSTASSKKIPSSSYLNQGFFVCVDSTTGTSDSRKFVEIHASASAQNNTKSNPLGWSSGSGSEYAAAGKPIYEVITQAYARAN